jgi:hypothetical protein
MLSVLFYVCHAQAPQVYVFEGGLEELIIKEPDKKQEPAKPEYPARYEDTPPCQTRK